MDEYINQGFTYSPEFASINAHPKPNKLWEKKLKHCVPNFYQNSSSSPRSLVTPADFLQIFIFATRWHRDAMLSGSENGKMLKYACVKYRSAEYITQLHLRPIELVVYEWRYKNMCTRNKIHKIQKRFALANRQLKLSSLGWVYKSRLYVQPRNCKCSLKTE